MEDLKEEEFRMPPRLDKLLQEGPFGMEIEPNLEIREEVIESVGKINDFQSLNEDLEGNFISSLIYMLEK